MAPYPEISVTMNQAALRFAIVYVVLLGCAATSAGRPPIGGLLERAGDQADARNDLEGGIWEYKVIERSGDKVTVLVGKFRVKQNAAFDDVINVSGHRMGTAEVESALVAHDKVAESAVVGYPHDIKGQGIYAYVTLNAGEEPTDELRKELVQWVRKEIGPIASPDLIQWAPGLPKTRSGKIMRRILRKIAENDYSNLGDTSTLADPGVVDDLINNRMNRG